MAGFAGQRHEGNCTASNCFAKQGAIPSPGYWLPRSEIASGLSMRAKKRRACGRHAECAVVQGLGKLRGFDELSRAANSAPGMGRGEN